MACCFYLIDNCRQYFIFQNLHLTSIFFIHGFHWNVTNSFIQSLKIIILFGSHAWVICVNIHTNISTSRIGRLLEVGLAPRSSSVTTLSIIYSRFYSLSRNKHQSECCRFWSGAPGIETWNFSCGNVMRIGCIQQQDMGTRADFVWSRTP